MEIIVISIAQYKEKDAVINAITDNKTISFYARGILSPRNKNSFLSCLFTKANISLIDGKIKYPILENAELISSPMNANYDYGYMTTVMLLNEAIIRLFPEEERFLTYDIISSSLEALKNNVNPLIISTFFLFKILPLLGFGIEVNKCLICGSKKQIVDFSFIEGGFLCAKCAEGDHRYTNKQLMLIRNNILSNKPENIPDITTDEVKSILIDLNNFVEEGIGFRLKQLDTLLK